MDEIIKKAQKTIEILLGSLVGVLTLLCIWQVIARYFFKMPTVAEGELAQFGLVWMAFLGGTLAFARSEQLAFTLFHEIFKKKSPKTLFVLKIIVDIIVIIVLFGAMIIGGFSLVSKNMSQLTPVLQIKKGIIYSIIPLAGILSVFFQTAILVKTCKEGLK